jgi:hypothetical protein
LSTPSSLFADENLPLDSDSLSPNDHVTEGFPPTILFYGVKDVHHFREGVDFVLNSRGLGNAVKLYASDDPDHDARLAHNPFKYSPRFERTLYLLGHEVGI